MLLGIGPDGPVRGSARRHHRHGRRVVLRHRPRRLLGRAATARARRRAPGARTSTPSAWFGPKEARRVDRFAQFSVAAADMALDDAGEIDADPDRSGVIFGTGVGGLETLEDQIVVFVREGAASGLAVPRPHDDGQRRSRHVSMRAGWHGPCETIATACAAGTHAIGRRRPAWWPPAAATSPSAVAPKRP